MEPLVVGGRSVARDAAFDYARRYLTAGEGWAYPSYDGYDHERAAGPLRDADLLAPVLLNVRHLSIPTFEALRRLMPRMQLTLDLLPPELSLADAGPEHDRLIGRLFAVLDDPGVRGAQGTVLAMVLHRKRPALIPLYDEQVRRVYMDGTSMPAPVPYDRKRDRHRSWEDFIALFVAAVRVDLRRELPFWQDVAALAPAAVPITPLRALDIVAWWAGNDRIPPAPNVPED
jgi:hypothetical protein